MANVAILNLPVAVSVSGAEYFPLVQGDTTKRAAIATIVGFSGGTTAQDANTVYAGPTVGDPTAPTFRALVSADLPIVPVTKGGTGLATVAQGDLLYASAADTIARLAKSTSATRYLANTGSDNNPAWALVNVANGVTGTLAVANGGTGATTGTAALSNLGAGNVTTITTSQTVTPTEASPYYYIDNSTTSVTLGFSAASGAPSICSMTIENASTSARATISPNGLTSFFLWPGQIAVITRIGNAWAAYYDPIYKTLLSAITFFVNPASGDDANDGLTYARAKKTIQNAINTLVQYIDCCENNPTIQIGDGSTPLAAFTEDNVYLTSPVRGTHVISISGNFATPADCPWRSTNGQVNFTCRDNGVAVLSGISFSNTGTGGKALSCTQGGILDIRQCDFGTFTGGIHIEFAEGGQVGYNNDTSYTNTISGNAEFHWYGSGPSKLLCSGTTIKAIGARTFGTSFARLYGATITTAGVTFDTSVGSFNGVAYIRDTSSTLIEGTALPGTQGYFTQDTRYTNGTPAFNLPYDGLFLRANGSSNGVVLANGGTLTGNRTWSLDFGDQNCTLTLATNTTITSAASNVVNQSTTREMCKVLGAPYIVYQSGAAGAVTGTTTETLLATIPIPAGSMGANGAIEGMTLFTLTNNANAKTVRVYFGASGAGLAGTKILEFDMANFIAYDMRWRVSNTNSASAQYGSLASGAFGGSTTALLTAAINTANASEIAISIQNGNAGDTSTMRHISARLLYAA